MPVSTPRDKIVRRRIRQLHRACAGAGRGDAAAIHVARTAVRRLRELVPLLDLSADRQRRLDRALRKVGRRLGTVRTLDSQIALVEAMRRIASMAGPLLDRIGCELQAEAARCRADLVDGRLSRRLGRIVRAIRAVRHDHQAPSREDGRRFLTTACARVVNRAAAVRLALGMVGAGHQPEQLHRLRVGVKKLRYAAEVFVEATGAGRADLLVLERVQDILGRQHDVQVLLERVRMAERGAGGATRSGWRECVRMAAFLDGRSHRLHGRYIRNHMALLGVCRRLGAVAARAKRRTEGRQNGGTARAVPHPPRHRRGTRRQVAGR